MAKRRRNPNAKAKTKLLDLPSDVLIQILTKLGKRELEPLTRVSKSFKSLADQLVRELKFDIPTLPPDPDPPFRNIFARFTSVTRIELSLDNPVAAALLEISKSPLKIEELDFCRGRDRSVYPTSHEMIGLVGKFGTVKVLRLDWFECGQESQVVEFVHLFPSLEELELMGCDNWTDVGIEKLDLGSAVPNLREIDLSFNKLLTDQSFDVLSKCVYLESLIFDCCDLMTAEGFCRFVRNRRNLTRIKLPSHIFPIANWQALVRAISGCENLSHLSISDIHNMPEDFILSVAKIHFPLTSLEYTTYISINTPNYLKGLSAMLSAFQGLTTLDLCMRIPQPGYDTYDMKMSLLVKSLYCLKNFWLSSRLNGCATLFSLIHNCPSLESVYINFLDRIPPFVVPQQIRKNHSIQSIGLLPEANSLKAVLKPICPSAKIWD